MAKKVRTITLSWENKDSFIMEAKLDDGDWKKVVEADENGQLAALWDNGIELMCKTYFDAELNIIGAEMKS